MNIKEKDGKAMVKLEELQQWDKNPRSIQLEDFKRLKKQIVKLGQYKPLIVNQDGIIVGGNMRFLAYQELDIKEVWVSVVTTQDEKEMLAYALSDNDAAGSYDEPQLAELITHTEIELETYHVNMGKSESLKKIIDRYAPPQNKDAPQKEEDGKVECPKCGHRFDPDFN